ncbi:MAG TPA: VTT domain-containing protein [Rubrobacteraceae bacterium]|nr:VTT domain-containing protein [Rubrobacteraceae bacterium]
MNTIENILSLIAQYGYLIVLFGVMLESMGIPLPGETILISAGILVQQGRLDLGDAILFGIMGAVIGDQIGYWIGRRGGRPFILRWGRYVLITPERLARAEAFFARHGGKAVFLARFVTGLRVFGALVAGVSRMRWRTFFLYNALGGATWATAAVLVGYLLGGSVGLVEKWIGRASALLAVALVAAIALYLAYRWVRNHPELVRRTAVRLGGRRVLRFLDTPAGMWLRRRLAPGEAYGLAFTAGLVLFGLFSWAFGGITQDVLARDPLVRADAAILRFFHSHGDPRLTAAVSVFETVFSPESMLLAGALAGAGLLFAGRRSREFEKSFAGAVLLATSFGTGALVELFKHLFHRPRPPASLQFVAETGNSFPSGHAMTALVVGATVWYLFSIRPTCSRWGSWQAKARIGALAAAFALVVGVGRVYTGAHYPSDVLAGWALGGVWASICLTAAEVFRGLRASGKPLTEPLLETAVRYAQFSFVGALNAAVDLAALNLFLILDPTREPGQLVLYNAAALVLANANSYLWNTLWTFRHHARHDGRQVGMFVAQAVLNVGVGSLVFYLCAHLLAGYSGLSPFVGGNAAKIVSMLTASTMSFLILRHLIFHKEKV